jgi:hypothetical protein
LDKKNTVRINEVVLGVCEFCPDVRVDFAYLNATTETGHSVGNTVSNEFSVYVHVVFFDSSTEGGYVDRNVNNPKE